jgi:hypothetical protein
VASTTTRTLRLRVVGDETDANRALGNAADDLDRTADRADKLGKAFGRNETEFRRLGDRIDESRAKLQAIGKAFEDTGNEELFKDFNRENRTLAKLERIKRAVDAVPTEKNVTIDVDEDKPSRALQFLEGASTALLGNLGNLGGAFQSALQLGSASAAGTGTAVVNLSTNILNLAVAAAAVGAAIAAGMAVGGAAISVATGLAYVLAGALAALPAVSVGAAAGIGVLALGVSGLADNWKQATTATKAGGAAAQDLTPKIRAVEAATRELSHAERDVAEAQKAALQASQDVARARQEEKERVEDLGRTLAGARLDEQSAVLDVADAQRDLDKARRSGNVDDIKRAEIAYEQAKLRVEEVRDRVQDLSAEQAKAAKTGVEGSDLVQQALERQRQAQLRLADAQERQVVAAQQLADAQKELAKGPAGGGGVAKQIAKLAPAAKEFLDVILGLRPAFDKLRLGVQQKLFAGLAAPVQMLADRWLPALETSLGRFADTFNSIFKTLLNSVSTPQFIKDMQTGMESVRRLVEKVGQAIAGPFVKAFGQLTAAAGPFLDALGDELAKVVTDFADWIDSADRSGKLQDFMEKAGDFLHDVFDIGRDVGRILGGIAEALFGNKDSGSKNGWDAIVQAFDALGDWFQNPENQKKVADFAKKLTDMSTSLIAASITIAGWIDKIDGWVKKVKGFADGAKEAFGIISGAAGGARSAVEGAVGRLVGAVAGIQGRINKAARGMFDGIWRAFRDAINHIVDGWNGLSFSVGGGSFLGVSVPGFSLDTPNLPHLAKGGFVEESGMAVIHKGETVVPAQATPLAVGEPMRLHLSGSGSLASLILGEVRAGRLKLSVGGKPVAVAGG